MARIAVAATVDVENYGDCLFPIVAGMRLQEHGFDAFAVSPTGNATRWTDSPVPVPVSDLFGDTAFDGAIIGGGNIVHNHPDKLPEYRNKGIESAAYAALWSGVTLACGLRNVPVAWNAIARPHILLADNGRLLPHCLKARVERISLVRQLRGKLSYFLMLRLDHAEGQAA